MKHLWLLSSNYASLKNIIKYMYVFFVVVAFSLNGDGDHEYVYAFQQIRDITKENYQNNIRVWNKI